MEGYSIPRIPITYYPDSDNPNDIWDNQYALFVPTVGTFIKRANRCYRVDEVWLVDDKHESVSHGVNVFLTTVDVMEHRLGQFDPSYYKTRDEEI